MRPVTPDSCSCPARTQQQGMSSCTSPGVIVMERAQVLEAKGLGLESQLQHSLSAVCRAQTRVFTFIRGEVAVPRPHNW